MVFSLRRREMVKTVTGPVTTYQGSIRDILENLCKDVGNALNNADIPPTGVHLLAALLVITSRIRIANEDTEASKEFGKMPSCKLLLSLFTRNLTGTPFTKEED